jgi:hypothetical protein
MTTLPDAFIIETSRLIPVLVKIFARRLKASHTPTPEEATVE